MTHFVDTESEAWYSAFEEDWKGSLGGGFVSTLESSFTIRVEGR